MDLEIRAITDDEFPAFGRTIEGAFGNQPTDEELDGWRSVTELARTLAVFDEDRIVATAGAFTLDLTVPGGATVAAAGVTAVGVRTSHRRRGLLRAMMERQLDDVAARHEPIAILTASESLIYNRFGYGLATSQASIVVDTGHSAFTRPLDDPGRMRMLDGDEAWPVASAIHERARLALPGDISRSPAWWARTAKDADYAHPHTGKLFWAVHRSAAGVDDGFVTYRVKISWSEGLPDYEVSVVDLIAESPTAEAALWRFVLDIDLATRVTAWSRPVEEPLRWRLADPRRLRTTSVRDDLWVRFLDVAGALAARRYGADGSLVVELVDGFRPQLGGRYRLDAGSDGATCERTTDRPDLTMGEADLAASYLGNPRFTLLARAGRVEEHTPGALRRADRLFATDTVPFCRTAF
jgi:predicted acetyltransferase